MRLSGNTILITGGATGIGFALAKQFIGLGSKVIICGRREGKLDEAKKQLPQLITKVCDLELESERVELANWIADNYPKTNVLFNNAGVQNGLSILSDIDIQRIRQELEINFIAPLHLSNLFVPILEKSEHAYIVNISSGLAFTPLAFLPVYCATKAALHSISLSLRHILANSPIRVFEIAPPIVDTELDRGDRANRGQTNHGITADECAALTIEALKNDVFEAGIGQAENLRLKREEMFAMINR
jgi:uncharacterized oxidoreductase